MKLKNILGAVLVVAISLTLVNCGNQVRGGLRRVNYDYDKSSIRSDMIATMDSNAKYLKGKKAKKSARKVEVAGHCDNRGTNEYNYALGARRAESAKSYLVSKGLNPDTIKTVSYGEDRPLCKEDNESCWEMNRRADFTKVRK